MAKQSGSQSNHPSPGGKGLRVLQVIPALHTGGAERATVDIARALVAGGHTALVAARGGRMVEELKGAGAEFVPLPVDSKNPARMMLNSLPLARLIRSRHIDLVHARSRAPAWSAFLAARRCKVPFVTTYHGTYAARSKVKHAYNAIMVKGDRVIANSHFIAEQIARLYHLPRDRIVTIPRGLDFSTFDPQAVSPARLDALRRSWELAGDDRPIILLPGRLTRWKGQPILIEAAADLIRRGTKRFVCILAGDAQGRTAYEDELRRLIDRHGLAAHVKLVGHCNDMAAAYALSTVVVSASTRPEAFGRIAIEAQAMGRPVVVTDHGGSRETVLNGETGWRVAPGDAAALAQALDATLSLAPEARRALAARARAHVIQSYSVNQMCDKTLALYQEIAGVGSRGTRETQGTQT